MPIEIPFRKLCILGLVIISAGCTKTPVDPYAFIEGPYDCKCEIVNLDIDESTWEWVETRDSLFQTETLTVLDSMSFEFWNGKFECDVLLLADECSDDDYRYLLRIPKVQLFLHEGRLIYKEAHNSASGPMHGRMTCNCLKQQ